MPVAKIIILNWNGADHLRRFLPSVVAAAPAGVEVIVADNGSTDDSLAALAAGFPSVTVLRMDRNYGFAGGYNRALEYIEADYYLLLNSDVETPEGWLAPILDCLDRNPDVAVAAPKLISCADRTEFEYAGAAGGFIDYLGYPFCRGRILRCVEKDRGQYDDERDVFWVSGAAFCCRADVFRALGGFDGDFFAHMEEIDLCWRMQLGVTGCGSCPGAGSTTWAAARSRPILRPRSSTITGTISPCFTSAPRPHSGFAWPSRARRSTCSPRCPTSCRAAGITSAPCSAPGATSSAGTGRWPANGVRSARTARAPPRKTSTAARWCCAIFSAGGPSAA